MPARRDVRDGGPRFREAARHSHTRRRPEPEHRPAVADGEGEVAPVVAALVQGQGGQRDVVKHRGHEPQPHRRLPRCRGQLTDWHHACAQDQAQQEDRAAGSFRQDVPGGWADQRADADRHKERRTDEREVVGDVGKPHVDGNVGGQGYAEHHHDDADACPVDVHVGFSILLDGLKRVLLSGGDDAGDGGGDDGSDVGVRDVEGGNTPDPHHGGGCIPHHRTSTAGVRRGDDCREVAEVDLVVVDRRCHRGANNGGSDVIQEAR